MTIVSRASYHSPRREQAAAAAREAMREICVLAGSAAANWAARGSRPGRKRPDRSLPGVWHGAVMDVPSRIRSARTGTPAVEL